LLFLLRSSTIGEVHYKIIVITDDEKKRALTNAFFAEKIGANSMDAK
jgi:hypothetical protein